MWMQRSIKTRPNNNVFCPFLIIELDRFVRTATKATIYDLYIYYYYPLSFLKISEYQICVLNVVMKKRITAARADADPIKQTPLMDKMTDTHISAQALWNWNGGLVIIYWRYLCRQIKNRSCDTIYFDDYSNVIIQKNEYMKISILSRMYTKLIIKTWHLENFR